MHQPSPEFLERCPRTDGFRMRGGEMTRIEVFIDAAFAFAVTLLVISFDAIPRTFPEMITAIKTIPAFVAAVAQLVWIWQTHKLWCERYGLDDGPTVWLSALLLVVMLVYIYPMRVMLEGLFMWISGGFFPSSFDFASIAELRFMFVFLGAAFTALCVTFVALYRYAQYRADRLLLDREERRLTRKVIQIWSGCGALGLVLATLALFLPDKLVPLSGFTFFLIGIWVPFVEGRYRSAPKPSQEA